MRSAAASPASLFLLVILAAGPALARSGPVINWSSGQPLDSVALVPESLDRVTLSWPDPAPETGLFLLFYSPDPVFTPNSATLLGATQRSFYCDPLVFPAAERSFYKVLAFPQGLGWVMDEIMIEDFEDGQVNLTSYPGQDQQPDAWELTATVTYDSSLFALTLFGNTWKIEQIPPVQMTAGTVWRAAVRVTYSAEIQALGVGDGDHELFYQFRGTDLQTGSNWNTTFHSVSPLNQWAEINLPIGRDWLIRWGELPVIDRIFYVNDKDAGTWSSPSFFDEIHDITEDLPQVPQVFITAVGDSSALHPAYQFTSLVIDPDSPTHTYYWDFGDDTHSTEPNPSHTYADRGYRTVSLQVMDGDSLFGDACTHLLPPPGTPLPSFTLNAAGDVMLARRYEEAGGIIPTYGVNYIFERTKAMFGDAADVSMVNLECPLTDEGYQHPTKQFSFRGSPENVAGLQFAGFDYVALGNNHTTDYMEPGLLETIAVLDTAGILFSGSGMNEYWATRPAFFTTNGIRVAVLSYCNRDGREDFLPPFLEAGYNKAGFAMFDEPTLEATIPLADSLADLVIVQVHAGTEYDPSPLIASLPPHLRHFPREDYLRFDQTESDSTDRALKQRAIQLGADLVLCHHPHILQGFEVYQGKLIAHSFGNFAFDQYYWETYPSMILYCDANLSGFSNFTFRPVYIDDYLPTPATGELGETILRRMMALSQPLANTQVVVDSAAMEGTIALNPAQISESHRNVSATLSFTQDGSWYVSEPLRVEDPGVLSAIVSVTGIPGGQLQLSRGREILFMGGMEFEGGWMWVLNSPDVYLDPVFPYAGTYSLGVRRSAGELPLWGQMEDRIPTSQNQRYSIDGYMAGSNARDANVSVVFYSSRSSGEAYIAEFATASLNGNFPWTRLHRTFTAPQYGYYANVRGNNSAPSSGNGYAKFDDLKLVEWNYNWSTISTGQTNISYPNESTFIQLRCNQAVSSATVTYRMTTRTLP